MVVGYGNVDFVAHLLHGVVEVVPREVASEERREDGHEALLAREAHRKRAEVPLKTRIDDE